MRCLAAKQLSSVAYYKKQGSAPLTYTLLLLAERVRSKALPNASSPCVARKNQTKCSLVLSECKGSVAQQK